jgi:hypothetical protein
MSEKLEVVSHGFSSTIARRNDISLGGDMAQDIVAFDSRRASASAVKSKDPRDLRLYWLCGDCTVSNGKAKSQ